MEIVTRLVQNSYHIYRVETYADNSRHLLRGTSFETLEYISGSGVILNSSGLRVVCESPDLDVIDKFEKYEGKSSF